MTKKYNIGVFFKAAGANGKPFTNAEYKKSYQELSLEATNQNANFYIVRQEQTYKGQGVFSHSWQFQGEKIVETGKITLDALYDKDRFFQFNHTDLPLFNSAELNRRCVHKSWILKNFPEFCAKTITINNKKERENNINSLSTQKIVIKPPSGAEGAGVQVINKTEWQKASILYPCLVQEFLNSSAGIPNIVDGIHDLRIALFNGKPLFSFVRTPPPKSLIANVAQGGTLTLLPINKIPKQALLLAQKIEEKMQNLTPRFYSVDVMRTPNGWRLIELESSLGLQQNSRGTVFKDVKKHIIMALITLAEENTKNPT